MVSILRHSLHKLVSSVTSGSLSFLPVPHTAVQVLASGHCTCKRLFGSTSRHLSVFEPDDFDVEPEVPEYEVLNIQMRGYDYVTLESYATFVHNIVKNIGLDSDTFPVPARTCRIQNYKTFSTNIQHTYDLSVYERTVQVEDLPSTMAPLLLEILQQNVPEGVNITVKQPDEEEDDFRYVPDIMLQELQSQVEDLDRAREDRKKK